MLSAMAFQHPVFEPWQVDLAGDALVDGPEARGYFERVGLDPQDVILIGGCHTPIP